MPIDDRRVTLKDIAEKTGFTVNTVSQALRGMQAGVAAVILDVVCGLGIKEFHSHSALRLCILGAAFIAAFVLDVNVIYIILATALVGVISALAARKRGGAK